MGTKKHSTAKKARKRLLEFNLQPARPRPSAAIAAADDVAREAPRYSKEAAE